MRKDSPEMVTTGLRPEGQEGANLWGEEAASTRALRWDTEEE